MSKAITTTQVQTAAAKLSLMRGSLAAWLRVRGKNDRLGISPPGRVANEQRLAANLHALLSEVMPDTSLPNGAVALATLAVTGGQPGAMQASPAAMGSAAAFMTWPVLIVGGLLIAIVVAIRTAADVAKDAEEKECIRAGACTDYGFWLKAGGLAMIGYVVWNNGGREMARKLLKKGGS